MMVGPHGTKAFPSLYYKCLAIDLCLVLVAASTYNERRKLMQKTKDYSELDLTDSFIFSKVMTDERLCKRLLEIILGIDILRIEYIEAEKDMKFAPDGKGVRLDVYVDDKQGTVYDIEMQAIDTKELPKRSRYYQSMIDLTALEKGASYEDLKKSYVIFICMADVFGKGRYVYTFRNICVEDPSIELGDDATKIFLNPYGSGEISEELSEFFGYLREHKPTGEFTKALDESVTTARGSAVWRKEYMTLEMEIRHAAHVAREEGETSSLVSLICKKLKKGMSVAQIAEAVEEDEARVQTIVDVANKYAPDYDVEKIVQELL